MSMRFMALSFVLLMAAAPVFAEPASLVVSTIQEYRDPLGGLNPEGAHAYGRTPRKANADLARYAGLAIAGLGVIAGVCHRRKRISGVQNEPNFATPEEVCLLFPARMAALRAR